MKLIVGLGNPGIEYQFSRRITSGFLRWTASPSEPAALQVRNRQCRALTARDGDFGNETGAAGQARDFHEPESGLSVR